MFVPPINLGQFQPSPATLADWIYQIWNYLQNNPIATQEQLQEYIATFITTSPETQELIGEGVEQYLTDNPPQAPVQSVQGKTGAVTLAFNDILKNNNTAPVYRAASMPSQSTLQAQYNLGYRLFVNTSTQEIYSITNTGGATLVGKGKFDGTDIDLDTAQGDTTIAEAIGALGNVEITSGTGADITDQTGFTSRFSWTAYKFATGFTILIYAYNAGFNMNGNSTAELPITYPFTFSRSNVVALANFTSSSSPYGCPSMSISNDTTSGCSIKLFNFGTDGRGPSPRVTIFGFIA